MAHIETWYLCPVCKARHDSIEEAIKCRNKHHVISERWAVGKSGKAVRIFDNWALDSEHGEFGALCEADLSDFIEDRKLQQEEKGITHS